LGWQFTQAKLVYVCSPPGILGCENAHDTPTVAPWHDAQFEP
jgi:hypothetical protein